MFELQESPRGGEKLKRGHNPSHTYNNPSRRCEISLTRGER